MQKHRDTCLVSGCGKASHGRSYCEKHMNVSQRRALPATLTKLIRSDCCNAPCEIGPVHDNGEQYCTKCKEACCWKA